jgi:ABC-type antimicrobial peptide transport system permease subunit
MEAEVSRAKTAPRIRAILIGSFAFVALMLACIGLYGVLASEVAHREREIGIRLALGATPAAVRNQTVWRGLRLTAGGLAAGLAGAYLLAQKLSEMLFGVTPFDWISFAGAAAILSAVAALSCWTPAYRASRIDPAATLRHD